MEYQAIKTKEVGIINGRDAIFLDDFRQKFNSECICVFKGKFNSKLIEINFEKEYIPYIFYFSHIIYYQCCELDTYINEAKMDSSFDLVHNSYLIEELKNGRKSSKIKENHRHYVLQTYDCVYDIIAKDYKPIIE